MSTFLRTYVAYTVYTQAWSDKRFPSIIEGLDNSKYQANMEVKIVATGEFLETPCSTTWRRWCLMQGSNCWGRGLSVCRLLPSPHPWQLCKTSWWRHLRHRQAQLWWRMVYKAYSFTLRTRVTLLEELLGYFRKGTAPLILMMLELFWNWSTVCRLHRTHIMYPKPSICCTAGLNRDIRTFFYPVGPTHDAYVPCTQTL